MNRAFLLCSIVILLFLNLPSAVAQASTFTYQGQLRQAGQPFTGMVDLEFRLYDQLSGGNEIGSVQPRPGWPIEDGLFQVELDFGSAAFDSSERFLEITVDGAILNPRQKLTATPFALLATNLVSGSVGAGSIDPTEVQLRAIGSCSANERIQFINQNGGFTCILPGLNSASSDFTGTVSGGVDNSAGSNGSVGGGFNNTAFSSATVGGGLDNRAVGSSSTIGGGSRNETSADESTIGGGADNTTTSIGSTIGGGLSNTASGPSVATVGGGSNNVASNFYSTVGGGTGNTASGSGSFVGGGVGNDATGFRSTVGGGQNNLASGESGFVGGGSGNIASGAGSAVGGGVLNEASGSTSAVGGGAFNEAAGNYSFVIGRRAKNTSAGHDGVFMFADSQDADFVSSRANAFFVRARGGAEFRVDNSGLRAYSNATTINGAAVQARSENGNGIAIYGASNSTDSTLVLNNGGTGDIIRGFNGGSLRLQLQSDGDLVIGGSLTQNSDRSRKEAIEPVDVQAVLDALRELPMFSWRYKHDRDAAQHIGPMAQDFHAAFGYGSSPNGIAVVDAQGVALASLQALDQELASLSSENRALRQQLAELETRYDARIEALQERQEGDLAALRQELAMLRDLLAPRVAQETR